MTSPKTNKTPMVIALVGSCVLAIAAAGTLWWASSNHTDDTDVNDIIAVKVGSDSCDPMNLTVPAGKRFFEIENTSERAVEWEILSGVMVLAERENILPGFKSRLSATLAPGEYEITCGLLTNPRGKMVVTPSDEWKNAVAAQPGNREFLKPLSEYRVYLILEAKRMSTALQSLKTAIDANDVDAAKKAWLDARLHYRKLDTFSGRFSDLEAKMNPQAQYLANRENDTAFVGFHRIEYGLWGQNSTAGLAPFMADLETAANDLSQRIKDNQVAPVEMLTSAENITQKLIDMLTSDHGVNAWAKDEASEMAASIDGIKKTASLMAEVAQHSAPQLQTEVNQNLDALSTIFKDGVNETGELAADKKQVLLADLKKLSEQLTQLQAKLGF